MNNMRKERRGGREEEGKFDDQQTKVKVGKTMRFII